MTWFFRVAFWGGLAVFLFLLMSAKPENALISWVIYFGFYYGNRWWMRFTLRRRKFGLYFASVIALILIAGTVIFSLLGDAADELMSGENLSAQEKEIAEVFSALGTFVLLPLNYGFLAFMQMVNFQVTVVRDWFHGAHVEDKLTHTEGQLLKTELNPHLFKNMLNNIYSLVLQKKDEAADAIVKLKSFMEYMLYDTNEPRVPLEKEIAYIHDLVEIERLRLPENFNLKFKVTGKAEGKYIAPLLLLPFIENAFRHGDLNSEKAFIDISLKVDDDSLEYRVKNKIPDKSLSKNSPGGKGLKNLEARLKGSYSGLLGVPMYALETETKGSAYQASLEIIDLDKTDKR
ncbi:MAG TPA: histidine kinase [Chitinophagales bacterium]|nr:histidine kinase [Chitinophagales bacterium]